VLDIIDFPSIIYIWYEGGELSPPLEANSREKFDLALPYSSASSVGRLDVDTDGKSPEAKSANTSAWRARRQPQRTR